MAAQDQHLDPEAPDRSRTDDEHPAWRHELCRTQHTRERLDPDAVVVAHRVGQGHAMTRAQLLGEATGGDPQLAKLAAGGLVAGEATLTRAARDAVHHRHARTVLELARDFVTEHRARGGAAQLFDVRAAEATRLHANEQPRAGRLRDVRQLRQTIGVENDRAHRPIVGGGGARQPERVEAARARAGTPITVSPAATSVVTTAPAPTSAPRPTVTPPRMMQPVPSETSSSIVVLSRFQSSVPCSSPSGSLPAAPCR